MGGDSALTGHDEQPQVSAIVGHRLRAWRREAHLTIREVAKQSGLSMSFISLVERGETEIAFIRLVRLADVFGRGVSDVLITADDRGSSSHAKIDADSGLRVHKVAGGVEIVYVGEPTWRMQPFMMTLEPGAVHGPVVHSYEEIVLCLSGTPTLIVSGETVPLSPNDVMLVPENHEHVYGNASTQVARVFTVDLRPDISTTLRMWGEVHRLLEAGKQFSGHESGPERPSRTGA